MPRYDFKCEKCGSVIEVQMNFGESTVPVCCQTSMTKVFSSTPIHFKGGGFYITDYRSEGYKQAAKKDAAPAKAEAKPEAKPAAKAAPKPEKK